MIDRQSLIINTPCFAQFTFVQAHELAELMEEVVFKPQDIIVKENDLVDSVFIIAEGTAEVSKENQLIASLKYGEAIGLNHIGLYSTTGLRTATVTAITNVRTLKLPLIKLEQFLQQHPQLNDAMAKAAQKMLRMQFIKRATPFAKLPNERISWIMERIEERAVQAGEIIFHEGEIGESCYLICSGIIEIFSINADKSEHRFATLKKPAIFGEVALLTETPRNASARAVEDSQLLVLHKSDFLEVVKQEQTTTDAIMDMMVERARPLAKPNITVHHRQTNDGSTIITLKNSEDGTYYQLSEEGLFIWQQLNGKNTLRDITQKFYKRFAVRAPDSIYELVCDLVDGGFATNPSMSAQLNQTELSFWTRALLKIRDIMEAQWAIGNVDTRLTSAYQKWAHIFFTKPAAWLMTVIIIIGLGAFVFSAKQSAAALSATHHLALILVGSMFIGSFTVILHELAHALATKYYGRHVYRLGVGWYWLGPIAFTDTSDMWLSDRKARTIVNIAGVFNDLVCGGIFAIAACFVSIPDLKALLWLLAFSQIFGVLRNLSPLLEFDGYYILMDLLDKPDLRESALFWLAKPIQWRAHKAELLYWISCISFLLIAGFTAYLIQVFVISTLLPSHVLGVSTSHLRWVVPLLAITVSSLGIYAEVRRRKALAE